MHEETYRMLKALAERWRKIYGERAAAKNNPPTLGHLRELAEIEAMLEERERRAALPSRCTCGGGDSLQPMLTVGTDEDDRALAVAEAERLFSEGHLTFEGDQPIGLATLDAWPLCLTWSDEQVAAVERWLIDSTAELPEVLRG